MNGLCSSVPNLITQKISAKQLSFEGRTVSTAQFCCDQRLLSEVTKSLFDFRFFAVAVTLFFLFFVDIGAFLCKIGIVVNLSKV